MNRRVFATLLITPFMEACHAQRQASAGSRFIVTLVDHSETMKDFRKQQLADLTKIMASMNGGDTLQVYPITENPLSSPEPVSIQIDPYDPRKFNPFTYRLYTEHEIIKQAKAAMNQVKVTIFDQEMAQDTAIIDSLELAARAFRTAAGRGAGRRELILLTDLWEDQKGKIRFPYEKLTPKRIGQLLERIAVEKRLADLSGAEVWVGGARIHRNSPREFEDGVEAFWLAAFSRMNAKASGDRFAPSLRDFPSNPKLLYALTDNSQEQVVSLSSGK